MEPLDIQIKTITVKGRKLTKSMFNQLQWTSYQHSGEVILGYVVCTKDSDMEDPWHHRGSVLLPRYVCNGSEHRHYIYTDAQGSFIGRTGWSEDLDWWEGDPMELPQIFL